MNSYNYEYNYNVYPFDVTSPLPQQNPGSIQSQRTPVLGRNQAPVRNGDRAEKQGNQIEKLSIINTD